MSPEPPLAVDIDGTLTFEDGSIDPEVMYPLRSWKAPIVVATGKVLPNATSLCKFTGIPQNTVAETGGIVYADDQLVTTHEGAADDFREEYLSMGYSLGWGESDIVNRWRETEIAISLDNDLAPIEKLAQKHGLEVVDTGYAYHVKSPDVSKAKGLKKACEILDLDVNKFVAIGDSENDVPTFEVVGESYAVGNADEHAKAEADHVTRKKYSKSFLEAINEIKDN